MRGRRAAQEQVAEVARWRLELLSAELATLREATTPHEGVPRPVGDDPVTAARQSGDVGPAAVESWAEPLAPGRHARRPLGPLARVGGWLHDQLPPTLHGRVALTSGHLAVVALLVGAGLALTAWWSVRADGGEPVPALAPAASPQDGLAVVDPSPEPPPTSGPLTSPAAFTPAAAAGSAAEPGAVVVVDVTGRVRRPGIVTLPVGARVVDALEEAGGARRGVDLVPLNLARLLVDGEQIVVGVPPAAGVAAPAASAPTGSSSAAGSMVNINSASEVELEELPGVGPVTAAAIVQWRTEHGAFTAVDELLEVSGIGDATLAEMAPYVTL
ncbi:helix-hairpin-helix domain-containing protein [Nocardioides sp. WL0053]|uniref:Helix-hairpin-helix domain-containing protein n=1 Tax=Nocardioides jiangsuensis TaxID=2866161 RepID=A0ABS7RNX4_9ACTN|nr:helix-hairpin-helix domain-containing protein [Nocardioides jiangsuensis]MBY9076754.1 helix-hairpin-helix domain-containing protein [Nocardioides jiangsuensis]